MRKPNRIWRLVEQWNTTRIMIHASKKILLPGFDGLPLYDVARFFITGLQEGYITTRASAISYNFFLAVFPSIIFLFTIIPFVPIADFQGSLLKLIQEFLPHTAYETVRGTVEDIITRPNGGLLSVGFILTLYFSTNGINSLMEAFNNTFHSIETRSWFQQRVISMVLVFILSVLLIIAIGLITLGPLLFSLFFPDFILKSSFYSTLLWLVRWLITLGSLFFAVSFIYYLAPVKRSSFRFISAGGSLATVMIIATTLGFNFYVDNFSKYNILYGSIGTLLIVLLWIYFIAFSLLIGFELNASIFNAKKDLGKSTF